MIIAFTIWEENSYFPGHLVRYAPTLPNGLNQPKEDPPLLPMICRCWVCLLLLYVLQPHLDVLSL
jgi:hypothetical protein